MNPGKVTFKIEFENSEEVSDWVDECVRAASARDIAVVERQIEIVEGDYRTDEELARELARFAPEYRAPYREVFEREPPSEEDDEKEEHDG
jgi:hypothetical protein